ncbi:MAG TPA: AHH domain-containing protein [Halomicronema sp.]
MQTKRYFENITIYKDSPLIKYLKISPGSYWGQFNIPEQKLLLKKKRKDADIIEIDVTLEQLLIILNLAARVEADKFTPQDIAAMVEIERASKFSSEKEEFIAHHVIPIKVWEESKLTIEIKKCGFDLENSEINRLILPVKFHKGNHPRYSKFVADILKEEWDEIVSNGQDDDCEVMKQVLFEITGYLKDKINEMIKDGIASINKV